MNSEEIAEVLKKLKAPFPAHLHKDRTIPGANSKKYLYLPWQTIRDRLDELFPLDWAATYSDPVVVGEFLVIRCQLTILVSSLALTREGLGNDKAIAEVNERGHSKTIGSPPERARADAFRSAAEEMGLGSYLDDQNFVAKWMTSQGDGRGYKYARDNQMKDAGAMGQAKTTARPTTHVSGREVFKEHAAPQQPSHTRPSDASLVNDLVAPSYSDRLKETAAKTGHTIADVRRIAAQVLLRQVVSGADIKTDAECIAVQEALLNDPVEVKTG